MSRAELRSAFGGAVAGHFGPDFETLEAGLAKVAKRVPADQFTRDEVEALNVWLALQLSFQGKATRAERSERNKARWSAGDRSQWGGERRRRDPRRGWRNFSR